MKTNFKKLASSAAVAAGLAAGSMSAHAVVQAVPANAQLIPFWYHNSSGVGPTREVRTDTIARITVPKSVGLDQVIGYLNPTTSPTGAYESDGDKDLSPVIINDTVLLPGGNNNQPLSNLAPFFQGDAIDANLYPNSFIHWWFLDVRSQHVVNGRFPVSQDDVVVISASNLGTTGAVPTGNIFNGVSAIPNNVPGYLILANESARNGGAPLFGLTADAWVANLGGLPVDRRYARYNGFPSAVNIPTFGLADGVDSTSYPTPANQVIQNQAFISGNFWPVASPLTSGIRTGVTGPNVTGRNLKVVEIPLADRAQFDNFVFVWNDRNNKDGIVQADEIDQDENACSTNLSLPQQLNVAWVPANNYGHWGIDGVSGVDQSPDGYFHAKPPAFIVDSYAQLGAKPGSAFYPSNIYNGQTPLCQTNSRDGFVKAYLNPPAAPAGAAAGAYASLVTFTIPQLTFPIDPSHGGLLPGQLSSTRPTLLGQDRGFFSGR